SGSGTGGARRGLPGACGGRGAPGAGSPVRTAGHENHPPPIIQATYPDPEPGEPMLHRSLFECLKAQDPDRRFTATLLENWRMSRTLCTYPAEQIYTPEYRSATPEIASRRLVLTKSADRDELADVLVDPDYPLVIGVLDGVRAAAENRLEADLVARAVVRLRSRLQVGPRRRYPDSREGDEAFWKDG